MQEFLVPVKDKDDQEVNKYSAQVGVTLYKSLRHTF